MADYNHSPVIPRTGVAADLAAATAFANELLWTTDTKTLYVEQGASKIMIGGYTGEYDALIIGTTTNATILAAFVAANAAGMKSVALRPATWQLNDSVDLSSYTAIALRMLPGAIINTDITIRSAAYKWTASGSGTNEFYLELAAGGDPGVNEPTSIWAGGTSPTGAYYAAGTAGSLSASEWDWADNDTLGYSTVYIRLADDADPDGKAADYVWAGYALALPGSFSADPNHQCFSGTGTVSGLSTVHPAWFGLSESATGANNILYLGYAISAVTTGGIIEFLPGKTYPASGQWTINKACNIYFNGATLDWSALDTDANQGILITASKVNLYQPNLTGPQYASNVYTQKAIYAYGTDNNPAAPTYISDVNIYGGHITDWGQVGIMYKFVERFEITGVHIENMIYIGISLNSSKNGRVHHNDINNIDKNGGLAYGITATFTDDTGTSPTTNPAPSNILIDHNYLYDVGASSLDTHGGKYITFDTNIISEGNIGIGLQSITDTGGNYYPLTNCHVTNNIITTTVTDASYGIWVTGKVVALSNYAQNTVITGNTISGHGHKAGALTFYITNNTVVSDNTLYNVGAYGIEIYRNNLNFVVSHNTLYGMRATHAVAMIGRLTGTYANNGIIEGNYIDGCDVTDGTTAIAPYGIQLTGITYYQNVLLRNNQMKHILTSDYYNTSSANYERHVDYADHSTTGTGEDILATKSFLKNQFAAGLGYRVTAAGTKTGANGNKTGKYYLGASAITFHTAANTTTDWRFVADVWFTAANAQRVSWVAWDGITITQGYEALSIDISAADVANKITFECANKSDSVTQTMFIIEKLHSDSN